MPINFACPGCGTNTLVDAPNSGKTYVCISCGQKINVIGPAGVSSSPISLGDLDPFAPVPRAFTNPVKLAQKIGKRVITSLEFWVCLLFCGAILFAFVLPAVQSARGSSQRQKSARNLKQIAIAILEYHDYYGELPPAYVSDAQGRPLYSGFVLLLPFMEQDTVYKQFNLDQPWDSPANLPVSTISLPIFKHPCSLSRVQGRSDYLLVGGPGSALDPSVPGKRTMFQITDQQSNTMIAVETKLPSRSWAEPRVWDHTQPFESPFYHWVTVAWLDGSVRSLDPSKTDAKTLRAYETASGRENVPVP